jgi:hypothetical protein
VKLSRQERFSDLGFRVWGLGFGVQGLWGFETVKSDPAIVGAICRLFWVSPNSHGHSQMS